MTTRSILIIEDEHALGTALSFLVRRMGHLPVLAATATAGLKAVAQSDFAALVLDIGLPDMSGLEFLKTLRKSHASLPVIVITAHATLDHAIDARKSGATGYLTKPLDLKHFEQTLASLLQSQPAAGSPVRRPYESRAATLIGAAPCLRDAFLGIAHACAGDMPALIHGPSGSGKSLSSSVIHAHSPCAGKPLQVLACDAIHHDTAPWTTDISPHGTLVLDEITALPPELQSQLSAWLADPHAKRPRVLATSTRDPREAMESGAMREELFYTLSSLIIPLPPLRERSGDIPSLCDFFIGLHGGCPSVLTPPVLAALQAYPWPGNVRELRHVLDYALTLSGGGPVFLSHLPAHIATSHPHDGARPVPGELDLVIGRWLDAHLARSDGDPPGYDSLLELVEGVMLRHLLERHDNRPTRVAAALRMHRATLRQKLRRLGLQGEETPAS